MFVFVLVVQLTSAIDSQLSEETAEETKAQNSLVAYDCANYGSERSIFSLIDTVPCSIKEPKISTQVVEIQVLQKQEYAKVMYVQCFLSYETVITYCGKFMGRDSFIKRYSTIEDLNEKSCQQMHDTKTYVSPAHKHVIIRLNQDAGYYNGFVAGTMNSNADCQGTTYIDSEGATHYNVYVHVEIKIRINKGV